MEQANDRTASETLVKTLLVDDHPLFRKGIAQTLSDLSISTQIIEAASAENAFKQLECHPDIDYIFLDLQLPDMDGLEFLAELKRRRIPIPVIILSANEDAASVDRGLKAGASGYLSKSAVADEIADSIGALEDTGQYVALALRNPLNHYRSGLADRDLSVLELTRRQHQVLQHMAEGFSNQQIAEMLSISESTVKGHVSTLLSIFNADNRTQCVSAARQQQLAK